MKAKPCSTTARRFLHLLGHPVALVGIKPLGRAPRTTVIWPREQDDVADQACWLSGEYASVYCNLNPLKPYMLDVSPPAWRSVADNMIATRTRILIDIDGHKLGKEAARQQKDSIKAKVGEPLIETDSGNGYGLIYPCDLPNDDLTSRKAEIYLQRLAAEFPAVDTSVYTLGRLTRVIGTLNRSKIDGARIPTYIL